MGKGDRRSKRGKLWRGTFGNFRPRASKAEKKDTKTVTPKKAAVVVAEPQPERKRRKVKAEPMEPVQAPAESPAAEAPVEAPAEEPKAE